MKLLVTKAIVEKKLQVAIGYNTQNFDTFIREAQEFDLKPLLCEEFYMQLLKETEPSEVMKGGGYQYNGNDYEFLGLQDVISYFTYARFIMKSPVISTTHGIVKKKTPESDPVDIRERKDLWHKYREEANQIFSDVKKYAERTNLPGWFCSDEPCEKTFNYKSNVIQ